MAVAVTNSTLATYNTEVTLTKNAATADVANTTEAFTITPTVQGEKILIEITNGSATDALSFSVAAGALWGAGTALASTVAVSATEVIMLKTAKYLSATGTIVITLTPGTDKKLLTDHAATMQVIQAI